jgi:hypothetical protein
MISISPDLATPRRSAETTETTNMTLSQIMKSAWTIYRARRGSFGSALRMAWSIARGFTHSFEVSFNDGSRIIGRAHSSDEARAAFIAAEHDGIKRGVKSLGGTASINLSIYRPAVEVEAVQPAMKLAA